MRYRTTSSTEGRVEPVARIRRFSTAVIRAASTLFEFPRRIEHLLIVRFGTTPRPRKDKARPCKSGRPDSSNRRARTWPPARARRQCQGARIFQHDGDHQHAKEKNHRDDQHQPVDHAQADVTISALLPRCVSGCRRISEQGHGIGVLLLAHDDGDYKNRRNAPRDADKARDDSAHETQPLLQLPDDQAHQPANKAHIRTAFHFVPANFNPRMMDTDCPARATRIS